MKTQLVVNLNEKAIFIKKMDGYEYLSSDDESLNFQTSPISGLGLIGVNRIKVFSKDNISKAGGYFSHYLKCNGYDCLTIVGKSDKPVFLYINNNYIKIYDAEDFFFVTHNECKNIIENIIEDDNLEICGISLGGAYGVDFSKIMFEQDKSCGKNGLGKIMGEKKLKAIVLHKNNNLKFEDENIINDLNEKMSSRLGNGYISSYFHENNNCFGCNLNCKSTSLKKLIKKGNTDKRAKEIDNICNYYGIDSVVFNQFLEKEDDVVELARKIIENPEFYNINNKNKSKEKDELDELGFCKFLINRNIIYKEELNDLIKKVNE